MRLAPTFSAVVLTVVLGGCVRDVTLGALPRVDGGVGASDTSLDAPRVDAGAPLDAAIDPADVALARDTGGADAQPVDAGLDTYTLTFTRLAELTCVDALGGRESEFAGLSAADCGLAEGAVTLVRTSSRSWTLGGAAISASFGRSSVRVAAGLFPDQPPEILVSTFALSGAGPRATQRRSGALGVDVSTGTLTHVDGFAGVELSNADGSGSCFVTFDLEVQR
jgi:hypothetical protein